MRCGHRAVLIVTRDVEGTSTNVARERKDLECCLEEGHEGPHEDSQHQVKWEDKGKTMTHILIHETD